MFIINKEQVEVSKYNLLVVGSGFAGATAANIAAAMGKKVLLLEERGHVGGNMHEQRLSKEGCRVHLYGPHIFHTDNERVFEYLSRFTQWMPYEHKVVGLIDEKLVPIPFNYTSLEMLFREKDAHAVRVALDEKFEGRKTVSIFELLSSEEEIIRGFGNYVFEKVFVHYTAKQWMVPIEQVDKSVINRVPVRLGYEEGYFSSKYQFMPLLGYNEIFENMLASPNIDVVLNCDASKHIELTDEGVRLFGVPFEKRIIYTGSVDRLLRYAYGPLPYRTQNMVFKEIYKQFYQSNAVVNYPNDEKYTRITEFKYLTGEENKYTSILFEYPTHYEPETTIPYYPVNNAQNNELYEKYVNALKAYPRIYLCGRLADYKYYDMDKAIEAALDLCERIYNLAD